MMKQENQQALPKRKRPVHMPPVERHNAPVILFVTLAVQPRGDALANPSVHEALIGACGDADAWSVGKYVIMPDHVHLFCRPARWSAVPVKRWSGYLKERITKRLKAILEGEPAASRDLERERLTTGSPSMDEPTGADLAMEGEPAASRDQAGGSAQRRLPVVRLPWKWQSDCWDTQMRSQQHYSEKWEYVRQNPVRKGLVAQAEEWPWQGELSVLGW